MKIWIDYSEIMQRHQRLLARSCLRVDSRFHLTVNADVQGPTGWPPGTMEHRQDFSD
jgi:hypothetical protein